MNLFFFCNYIFERRKPTYLASKILLKQRFAPRRPRSCRWFSDKEKLQAKLLKFAITIVQKPKNERKKCLKPNMLTC